MPFTGPEIEPAPPFQPVRTGQGTVASLAEAEKVLISTAARIQISRHLAEADGAYPYELPVHDSAITGTGTGMPGADTRQHEEWHHADPPPRSAGGWDATRESGPPPDRTDEGGFIAGDDDGQHGWDIGPPSPASPCGTPRLHPARRLPARLIAITALVVLCITVVAFVMISRNHTIRISPADNPAATASQPAPSVRGGGTPPAAAEPAALTKAAAARILARYWQVNNTANESRSGTLLKTVEAGSSYSMDAGTYQMDRVTDPANRQYTAFTAQNATYYIPRQSPGVYPRWFVARVTYASLAAPQHATGAGYVLFTQAAKNAPWKNDLEPCMLPGTGPGPFIETDAHGYAIAASASDEAGLSVTSRADPGSDRRIPGQQLHHGQEPRQPRRPARRSLLLRETARRINRHRQALGVGPGLRPEDGRRRRPRVLRPHGAAHPGTAARPDLPGQHPRLLLLQPDPDIGHHRVRRAIRHLYPAGPGGPADPRRRVRHHRTRVDDRRRVTGQQFPQLAWGRPRIRRRLSRRMRG